MVLNSEPIPANEPMVIPRFDLSAPETLRQLLKTVKWFVNDTWMKYLQTQTDAIAKSPSRMTTVSLPVQSANVVTTSLVGDVQGGLYRLTYYARITQAATTSSSLIVSFAFTESGVSLSFDGTAITGNTPTTVGSESFMIRVDQTSPITYATTYASVGATTMQYRLDLSIESLAL